MKGVGLGVGLEVVVRLRLEEEDDWPGFDCFGSCGLRLTIVMNIENCPYLCIISPGYST